MDKNLNLFTENNMDLIPREEFDYCIDRALAAAIIAKVPFIGVDYENTDRETAIKILKNIPRDLKRDLWHFCVGDDGETYIDKYTVKGEYKVHKHGSMENALDENDEDGVIWERIDKTVTGNRVVMFDSKNIGGPEVWTPGIIECVEKAAKHGCTVIMLDDILILNDEKFGSVIAKRLFKYGVIGRLAPPSEEELVFSLKQYLKGSKWKHPVKNKIIPVELSDSDIKKIALTLFGSNLIEARKKLSCLIANHLIDNDCEKIDISIIKN